MGIGEIAAAAGIVETGVVKGAAAELNQPDFLLEQMAILVEIDLHRILLVAS